MRDFILFASNCGCYGHSQAHCPTTLPEPSAAAILDGHTIAPHQSYTTTTPSSPMVVAHLSSNPSELDRSAITTFTSTLQNTWNLVLPCKGSRNAKSLDYQTNPNLLTVGCRFAILSANESPFVGRHFE